MMNTVSGPAFDHMMRLLDPDRLPPTTDASPGYLDLIGTSTDRHSTIAQAAMHTRWSPRSTSAGGDPPAAS